MVTMSRRAIFVLREIMKGRLFLVSDTMPTLEVTSPPLPSVMSASSKWRLRSRDGRLAGARLGLDRAVR